MKVGQLVRKRKSPIEIRNKLESKWSDSFWIVKTIGKGCYWVQGISGNTLKVNRQDLDPILDDEYSELSFEGGVMLPADAKQSA